MGMDVIMWLSLGVAVVLGGVARLIPRRHRFFELFTNLGLGGLRGFSELATKGVQLGIFELVRRAFGRPELDAGSPLVWLGALLAYDFLYYWSHRASHRFGGLWASHAVHHQARHMNLTVGLRVSLSNALFNLPFFLPLAAIGVPTVTFLGVAAIHLLAMVWLHTERIGELGVLERWINTPALHRVHHSASHDHHDKNFGGMLIIYDRLFGSYAAPERVRAYGIGDQPAPGMLAAHLDPWRDYLRSWLVTDSRRSTARR